MDYPELRAAHKRTWLKALRSGEYQQGEDRLLQIEDGVEKFCCLGVGADLFADDDWVPDERKHSIGGWVLSKYPRNNTLLDNEMMFEWFKGNPSVYNVEGVQEELAEMNDSGKSFKQIANWIEANL